VASAKSKRRKKIWWITETAAAFKNGIDNKTDFE